MISERSCDTEDWSNDAEDSALQQKNKLHFNMYSYRNTYFKLKYFFLYQINTALVSIRYFFKKQLMLFKI